MAWQSVEHSKHSLIGIKSLKDEILFLDCTQFSHQPNLHFAWRMCTSHSTESMSLAWAFSKKEEKIYHFFFDKENTTKLEVICLQSRRKCMIITVNKGRCSNHRTYSVSGYLNLSFSISWWQMTTSFYLFPVQSEEVFIVRFILHQ